MILFELRETIESEGVRRVFEGMRTRFPDQVPGWLAKLEQAANLGALGSDIADGLAEEIQQYVRSKAQQAARPIYVQAESNPAKEAEINQLKERVEQTETLWSRADKRAQDAEIQVWQAQHKVDDAHKAAAQQIERLTMEIVDLQRIVGEQQFLLNQRSEKPE